MKKIRFGIGGILMLSAMVVSDSARVIALYFCAALFHELGHLTAARLRKIGIREIRFEFSGVRICTEEGLTSYRDELLLSLAGPLANLLGAGGALCLALANGCDVTSLMESAESFWRLQSTSREGILGFFILSSLVQAVTNLLPVQSFDGGRILYCALARYADANTAERIVAIASALSAFVLWTVALYLMLRISSGLGVYVFAACIFAGMITEKERA